MIVQVNAENIRSAAEIHAESWRASHAAFCSAEFVQQHTVQRQKAYLEKELQSGKWLYMLIREIPVGIVSVKDSLIENLSVLPNQQRRGCGTELLLFAIKQCAGRPHLWVLSNNEKAQSLYGKHGFRMTGNIHPLSAGLAEWEMALEP